MRSIIGLFIVIMSAQWSYARNIKVEQEIMNRSKEKWQWMADKNVDKLATLFHDKAKFVHMSGTWNKEEELDIIRTGNIWYKHADVHDIVAEIFDDTVSTEFTVAAIYQPREHMEIAGSDI